MLRTALRAANAVGDGLYGVDCKMIGKKCYIIEVNDNPSIESGVEDMILKDSLYLTIMHTMYDRVCMKKEGKKTLASRPVPVKRKGFCTS